MDPTLDLKKIWTLFASLAALDKDAPAKALLQELDIAHTSLAGSLYLSVGDDCRSLLHGYFAGEYSTRECDDEGRRLYSFPDDLLKTGVALPSAVFYYLRGLARLAILVGACDTSTEDGVTQLMAATDVILDCSPAYSTSAARANLIGHLSGMLDKLNEELNEARAREFARSRTSLLAE